MRLPWGSIFPPILISWAPFWLSESTSESPVSPDGARTPLQSKKILNLGSSLDHIWTPKTSKKRNNNKRFFETLSGELFESSGPPLWELWATFLETFWDQVWKVKTELSLQREPSWEGWRVTDLWSFSHADPRLTPKLLWTRLLMIWASLLELILEPYGVTLGSPFSKTFQTLSWVVQLEWQAPLVRHLKSLRGIRGEHLRFSPLSFE